MTATTLEDSSGPGRDTPARRVRPPGVRSWGASADWLAPRIIGALWGALVAAIPLCDFLARAPRQALAEYNFTLVRESPPGLAIQLGLLLVLNGVPVLLALWRCGLDFRKAGVYPAVAAANVIVLTASLMGLDASTLLYVALITYCFSLSTIFAALSSHADEVMQGFLAALSVCLSVILCIMIWDANYSFGRLMGRSGPNYWGMVALATAFGALALRNTALKALVAIVAVATIYFCQSRGAMIAAASGGLVVWLLMVRNARPLNRLVLVGGAALVLAAALIVFGDFIATKLLLLDSRGRGLESGGTGRVAAWLQSLELFANSPWLGVGYRQHEGFITAASSAHNAYLASLADSGLIGFATFVVLMVGGAALAIRTALRFPSGISFAVAGLATSFLIVGFVERVGINTGNTLSLAMIYSTAWAFRTAASRRIKAAAYPSLRRDGGRPLQHPLGRKARGLVAVRR